jgi:hypothetical protein
MWPARTPRNFTPCALCHLDDPKGRRDLRGYVIFDGTILREGRDGDPATPRNAKIAHGLRDFSSRTGCLRSANAARRSSKRRVTGDTPVPPGSWLPNGAARPEPAPEPGLTHLSSSSFIFHHSPYCHLTSGIDSRKPAGYISNPVSPSFITATFER